MQRFKSILVCIDADAQEQQALERAVSVARETGAELTAVAAVNEPPWWTERLLPGVAKRWYDNILEDCNQKLEGLAARYRGEVSIATKTLVGRPWMEVIREVLRSGHDLVMKDVHANASFTPAFDMRLLRKCPCPVWMVKRSATRFRRIAAAVDVLPEDHGGNKLSAKVLELAHYLAVQEKCELHVVRAWSVYAESVLHYKLSDEEIEQLKHAEQQEVQRVLDEFLAGFKLDDVEIHVHVLEGEAEDVISTIVEREHEDLLVMGTIARTGVAGLVIGNTAEMILNRINCSVLAVKPDDFVSPVRLEE